MPFHGARASTSLSANFHPACNLKEAKLGITQANESNMWSQFLKQRVRSYFLKLLAFLIERKRRKKSETNAHLFETK